MDVAPPEEILGSTRRSSARLTRRERRKNARKMAPLYLFFVVPAVLIFIFNYIPMYGITLAFKEFHPLKGILGSPWYGFEWFRRLFSTPYFYRILRNTLVISGYRLAFGFPAPIVLALMINEVRSLGGRRLIQSITYLPHFFSWVVLSSIIVEILSPQRGVIGYIYTLLGQEAPVFLTNKRLFRPLLIVTGIWKEAGWGTIIYLAAISSIDPGLYESAAIDGAGRFRQAWHISLPSISAVITILFILRIGRILNAGFDQIFNMFNPIVYEVADIIDTYVWRVGLFELRYEFATAVGLFKNVVGLLLLLTVNWIVKRFNEYGIW